MTGECERPADFWEPAGSGRVRCLLCPRQCVLGEGERGWCGSRTVRAGRLYTLVYGKVGAMMVSAIEKKPLYHFHPGSRWLSLGTYGCNFRCPGCQNFELAHTPAEKTPGRWLSPEEAVRLAREAGCEGISFTYNEPTVWLEYILEIAGLARSAGLLLNLVTNGFMSEAACDALLPWLDAWRVDLKAFFAETYFKVANCPQPEAVLENICGSAESGVWVELVTNLIPGLNDSAAELSAMTDWIGEHLGPAVPWHLTRFHPAFKLSHLLPTPITVLEQARELALERGLQYVYLGNVPGHPGENTWCPGCGQLLIRRRIVGVLELRLRPEGICPDCGHQIPGHFERARVETCFDEAL